ncbi:protein kinase [Micromonospora sediminicola]|uniref:protein kinase domain-containing protein n=1 Tax=Micromonospora sediminicola TaxID=946078 RepID=UPI0033F83639
MRYGQLRDEMMSRQTRIRKLVDLLIEAFAHTGLSARRVSADGPAIAVVLEGAPYLIKTVWSGPVGEDQLDALIQAAEHRPTVRLVLVSMGGYHPDASRYLQATVSRGIVLLDGQHVEAVLCGLVDAAALLAEAAHRAMFDNEPYMSLTDLLIEDAPVPAPAQFVAADRVPAPWTLLVNAGQGVQVRHLLSGDGDWEEPLGIAALDVDRVLVTVADGIIEVDLKRGTTNWLLPLSGCRGAPLVAADGSVLSVCANAVVRWRGGVLTPVGGGFHDARALFAGPDGNPWLLSGSGHTFGAGTGTLALTRLSGAVGGQHRYAVHFSTDVHTAGWLSDLRFFLAAAGHSAVVDLAHRTAVRDDDWIETPHHSPDHLIVTDEHSVITASPNGRGTGATLYRTDLTTCTNELVTEIAINKVHGLTTTPDGSLLLLGDVRGNDTRPHPVLLAVGLGLHSAARAHATRPAVIPAPRLAKTPTASAKAPLATKSAPDGPAPVTVAAEQTHPYAQIRAAARGSRRDYAMDKQPIARGGQATVYGALHKPTGVRVALKRLNSTSPHNVARMCREIEAAQMFGGHPHVVPVLDFSPTHEWFVMPLVTDTAQTLAAELSSDQKLRELVIAICEALREPHQRGWIHRDLKPDNILHLDGRWAVADWGLGRRPRGQTTDPNRTQLGGQFGTEGFAAPELSTDAHAVGPQADIYSTGQIIGWALTGQWPRANVPLLPPTGPWRAITKAATDPEPARRPASVDALLALMAQELDAPPENPASRGEQLLAAHRAGNPTALGQLIVLAARHPDDYDLYLQVLVNVDDGETRSAVTESPSAMREIVQGVPTLHSGTGVTLEYGDVDRLVAWLLIVAYAAEPLSEWDLLEDTADSIFYLDLWDRWGVQADIRSWLAGRSGHAASVVAAALRRHPEIQSHFDELVADRRVDHRIRDAVATRKAAKRKAEG